jgi:GNAT superfamily N-acetyltransferase
MTFTEMSPEEFSEFAEKSVLEMAKHRARESRRDVDASVIEGVRAEMKRLIPEGQGTKDHFFYCLKMEGPNPEGWIWFCVREQHGFKRVFICDITVAESSRGKGYGKALLGWLEKKTAELRISEIGLHVFGENSPARKLYESSGYEITNLYLAKTLKPD